MKPELAKASTKPESAQADLLGEATVLQPPPAASAPPINTTGSVGQSAGNPSEALPAEDENQAAFITKRNLSSQGQ